MPVIRKNYGHFCVSERPGLPRHSPFVPFPSFTNRAMLMLNSFSGEEPVRAIRPMTVKSGTFCFWGGIPEQILLRASKKMVRPERFELPTLWFVAKCSIQLSYGRNTLQLRRFDYSGNFLADEDRVFHQPRGLQESP
jgi:hypothetical protein